MTIPALIYVDSVNPRAESVYNQMIENNEIVHVKNMNDAKMLLAIGGDGTLVRAIQWFTLPDKFDVGLIGVGTVNYLAMGVNPIVTPIHMIHYHIPNYSNVNGSAINEISIKAKESLRMLTFDIIIDDEIICENIRGDGVIIATSVGSTAYAMSAGGPIIDIGVPVRVIVPNNEYSRKSRPIVISEDKTIIVRPHQAYVICLDGHAWQIGESNYDIIITKGKSINLWHAKSLARGEKDR